MARSAANGHAISPSEFAERYRVAARHIGLRYMWWTPEYWIEDPKQIPWLDPVKLIQTREIGRGSRAG